MDELTSGIKSVSNKYLSNSSPFNQPQNSTPVIQNGNNNPQYIIVLLDDGKRVTHADKMNLFLLVVVLFLVIILAVKG